MGIATKPLLRLLLLSAVLVTEGAGLYAQNALNLAGLTSGNPAYVAFSMRRLSTVYTGNAMQVRRSSDNTTLDIGFTPGGELDVTALTAFIGANNGFVTIWYDQSGNARNMTQPVASRQPWIAHSGVVDTENGKPFIRFYGHNGIDFDTDALVLASTVTSTGHVVTVNKFTAGQDGFLLGNTGGYDWHSDNPNRLFHTSITTASILTGGVWQNGTAVSPAVAVFNSTLMINSVAPKTPGTGTTWNNIGSDRNGYHDVNFGGGYTELITFPVVLNPVARMALEKNQGAYYGITVPAPGSLNRTGALVPTASEQVNRFGRRGASALQPTGETVPTALAAAPAASNLDLSTTTADILLTAADNDGSNTTVGICWATSANPTIADSKTSTSLSQLSFTATMTSLVNGTAYYARSYATNALGTTYGSEVTFVHVSPGYAYLGGKVAYIYKPADPGYVQGEVHGLIAASADSGTATFGCNGTDIAGAEGVALGTGAANTANIVAQCATAGIAARLCDNYSVTEGMVTYTDWFLPSVDELAKLFVNRVEIGGLIAAPVRRYWSSSESSAGSAQVILFNASGDAGGYAKSNNSPWVRAVRYF